jgi:hypothetical protein
LLSTPNCSQTKTYRQYNTSSFYPVVRDYWK